MAFDDGDAAMLAQPVFDARPATDTLEPRSCVHVAHAHGGALHELHTTALGPRSRAVAHMDSRSPDAAEPRAFTTSLEVEPRWSASLAMQLAPVVLTPLRWGLAACTQASKCNSLAARCVFAASSLIDAHGAALAAPRNTRRRTVRFDEGFCGEWLWHGGSSRHPRTEDGAILYLHGGGFLAGGLNTHRRMIARISRESGVPALAVDYRHLPQAHLRRTVADCLAAYRRLLDDGLTGDRIVLCGDSAGAGLTFLLALACRDQGLPMPAGIAALSPWADLDNTVRMQHRNAGHDPYIPTEGLGVIAHRGFEIDGTLDPSWSPANADFTGLPPVLIQVGSTETLLADAEQLAQRCALAQVPCRLQIWDHAPHVFQFAVGLLPEARSAISDLGQFIRGRTIDRNVREQRFVSGGSC